MAGKIDFTGVARACGYPDAICVDNEKNLDEALQKAKSSKKLCFIEVKCAIGARSDLGRPTTGALKNKQDFMEYLRQFN